MDGWWRHRRSSIRSIACSADMVGGLPGVHAMFAGMDVTWHKPTLHGDEFTTKVWLKDLGEHQARFAGRLIQQVYRCEFFNQNIDLVAEGDSWCFRTEHDTAGERSTDLFGFIQREYFRQILARVMNRPFRLDLGIFRAARTLEVVA